MCLPHCAAFRLVNSATSVVIGSPVAGCILSHNCFAIDGWRWLFFLEGIPGILLGTVAFLTD
jgi:MFS transporter, ACS family, tartrate transporter